LAIRLAIDPAAAPRGGRLVKRRWLAAALTALVFAGSVGACSESATTSLEGIPVLPGTTRAAGTPLGDGFEVATGTALIGGVFPSFRAGFPADSVDDGWRAVFLVTGEVDEVLNAYTTQARRIGLFPQPRCAESDPGLTTCSGYDESDRRGIELYVQRGAPRGERAPLSHLFIRYRRTGSPPEHANVEAADESYGVGRSGRDVPDYWPPLPNTGRQYEDWLAVPEGTKLAAPPAMPWPGSVAVFWVTGDPFDVVQAATPRGAGVRRVLSREQAGARITTGYANSPSPTGTVTAEVVERPGQETYLLVEHDATD
jgi:hypothetical protein